jgi:hypothetical protein
VTDLGRLLVLVGVVVAGVGLLLVIFGDAQNPLGRLPGDLTWRWRGSTVHLPLVSSLVISLVLTLLLNLFLRHK